MAQMSYMAPPMVSLGAGIIDAPEVPARSVEILREYVVRDFISSHVNGFRVAFENTPVIDVNEWPFLTSPQIRRIRPGDVVDVSVQYSTTHLHSRVFVESVWCDSVECTVAIRCLQNKGDGRG